MRKLLEEEFKRLEENPPPRLSGKVTHVTGLLIESFGPEVCVGETCLIYGKNGQKALCQVVGIKDEKVLLMPIGDLEGIGQGSEVCPTGDSLKVAVSSSMLGRVLDALGRPLDGKSEFVPKAFYLQDAQPPKPLSRSAISIPFATKLSAIDGLCTLGQGQRIGIFSSPGVGKSTLLGMIAGRAVADVFVIALIGERGREVKEFIEKELGMSGLKRSVVVVATADQSALMRSKGAKTATAIAEYFRDLGLHVVLMMDSLTRYAHSLREIGLAVGEPALARGYPPSVFAELPRLLERAGNNDKGSITGLYTILREDEEMYDPISDAAKSLLDGHIHLSKELAEEGHFPPINVLKSLSRLMSQITTESHRKAANKFRALLHAYKEAKELIRLGAYVHGSDPGVDAAIQAREEMQKFLIQDEKKNMTFQEIVGSLEKIISQKS